MKLLIISRRVLCEKYTSLYLEDITNLTNNRLAALVKNYLIGSNNLVSDKGKRFNVDKDLTKILDTIKETYWSTTFKDTDKSEITFRIMMADLKVINTKLEMK